MHAVDPHDVTHTLEAMATACQGEMHPISGSQYHKHRSGAWAVSRPNCDRDCSELTPPRVLGLPLQRACKREGEALCEARSKRAEAKTGVPRGRC